MKLRTKTLLIIIGSLALLLTALFLSAAIIMNINFSRIQKDINEGFGEIETASAIQNGDRVRDALYQRIRMLSIKISDWARWDDTWHYMEKRNQSYLESNVNIDALLGLQINSITFFDTTGKIVSSLSVDLTDSILVDNLPDYVDVFDSIPSILKFSDINEKKSGILLLNNKIAMVAIHPILKSDGSGPIRGTLVFGRYLDSVEISSISELTHLDVKISDSHQHAIFFGRIDSVHVDIKDDSTLVVFSKVSTLLNDSSITLMSRIYRDINSQSVKTLGSVKHQNFYTLILLLATALFTALVMTIILGFVIDKMILRRILRIARTSTEIGKNGKFGSRLAHEGRDEIGNLSESLNNMLSNLERLQNDLKARNTGLQLIMNSIPSAMFSINENLEINPEYSKATEKIFGSETIAGKKVSDVFLFNQANSATLNDYLELFQRDSAPETSMQDLNPFEEFIYNNGKIEKILKTRYYLIKREKNENNHLLAIVEDVTESKKLAIEIEKSHEENLLLKAIAEDPDLYRDFLFEARRLISSIEKRMEGINSSIFSLDIIHSLFRSAHGLKGLSSSFGLLELSRATALFEDELASLRSDDASTENSVQELFYRLDAVKSAFDKSYSSARRILGDDIESAELIVRIPLSEIKKHLQALQAIDMQDDFMKNIPGKIKDEFIKRLHELQGVPAKKGFARALRIIPGLMQRLGKQAHLEFIGHDHPINCEIAHTLNTPLVHLIRNSLDHGIEIPEIRLKKNKPASGTIKIQYFHKDGLNYVILEDDGKGLDTVKIRNTAVKRGIIAHAEAERMSKEHIYGLIFRPGFSTVEEATDISGCGVGLDAVLEIIRDELDGTIGVESAEGKGTKFTIIVPERIKTL